LNNLHASIGSGFVQDCIEGPEWFACTVDAFECIAPNGICNGVVQCSNGADEDEEMCRGISLLFMVVQERKLRNIC